MRLTNRGRFALGVAVGALTVALLWWGQSIDSTCGTFLCSLGRP